MNAHKSLTAGDMVDLMKTVLMLCHPFLRREAKKFKDIMMFYLSSSSVIST